MKLLLITASSMEIRRIRKSRVIGFQQVTMPYLAAMVPAHWDVRHVDEEVQSIDFDRPVDLVGITFHTPSANHAYQVASRFRAKGIPVVLGGPHVSLMPYEASHHADAVFVGEAEEIWPRFIRDFEAGSYQRLYRRTTPASLDRIPLPCKDLFHRKDHSSGVLFATRGCPNQCEFCTIAVMYQNRFRKRPVAEVVKEIASVKGKIIIFWDDNISADLAYAKDLFQAIIPYRKWWASQASIHAGMDDEFLRLAARSGCKQLFLGLESISQGSLNNAHKSFNKVKDYRGIIRKIHSYGIAVQAGIVFGFDEDDKAVFKKTIEFLEDVGIQNATFNILTPYPGTPLFNRLQSEGRILTNDWRKYNARTDVVFTPKNMTCEELIHGFNWINNRFYSLPSIARRFARSRAGLWWALPLNLMYCASLKFHGYKSVSEVSAHRAEESGFSCQGIRIDH